MLQNPAGAFVVLILAFTLTACGGSSDLEDFTSDKGFRGMQWGSALQSGMMPRPDLAKRFSLSPGEKLYTREKDDMEFAGVSAELIAYSYIDDKFSGITVELKGVSKHRKIIRQMEKLYGKGTEDKVLGLDFYDWHMLPNQCGFRSAGSGGEYTVYIFSRYYDQHVSEYLSGPDDDEEEEDSADSGNGHYDYDDLLL